MTRPTPTLSEPVIIGQWWRNRRGEAIRISLSTFQNQNLVDVRVWATDPADGILKPTTKGIASQVRHLPKLVSGFAKAEELARELGLIASDDGGEQ
jgi:Transcriptional Coactivator p15 (PC4)